MRALELCCILGSFMQIIVSLKIYFDYMIVILENPQKKHLRKCLRDIEVMDEWAGSSVQWILLELIVFFSFFMTMVLLMLKSRCIKVGIDSSKQFESQYMSYLVNKIITSFIAQQEKIGPNAIYRKNKFVDHERTVEVEDVQIKIHLSEENYMNFVTKYQFGEMKSFIEERHAIKWIEDTIVGPITKDMLENERFKELDSLDMMQNTGIIYNPQSIIEM